MIDTILSIAGIVLLAFSVYAVVMFIWVAKQLNKAEKAFWEIHEDAIKHRVQQEAEHE